MPVPPLSWTFVANAFAIPEEVHTAPQIQTPLPPKPLVHDTFDVGTF
jgi:hypothetical protein